MAKTRMGERSLGTQKKIGNRGKKQQIGKYYFFLRCVTPHSELQGGKKSAPG